VAVYREEVALPGYEKAHWGPGGYGTELVAFTDWSIGMLMTRHHEDCRVRGELRRSVGKGLTQERRLALAEEAACTCGAREHIGNAEPVGHSGVDRRDNRDPATVGREYLNR
jgi:hypothetical protein